MAAFCVPRFERAGWFTSSPEDAKDIRRWLQAAAIDLAVARENLALGEERAGVACFHAQQGVEKALKAALIFSGMAPPRSHSLDALRNLLAEDWEIRSSAFDLAGLSAWAVTSRYPDEEPDPTIADTTAAVQDAERAIGSLRGEIERRGFA